MAVAVSASVGNLLSLAPARGNLREAFGQQGESCSHHAVRAASRSAGVLDRSGRDSFGLVSIERLRLRKERGAQERCVFVRASEGSNSSNNESRETGTPSTEVDVEALEARLGVGRRARSKQQAEGGGGTQSSAAPSKPKQPAKKWEEMSLGEKAWSLYIDPDKGILFWLNKLAYGAIFAVIGGWIVFRFIGPALGWYELDQPLLSPDRLLDGQ
ncbi:unnamed protein product [Calypogeia fissa]